MTLWYEQTSWAYIGHNLLQAVIAALLSLILHLIFNAIWELPITVRIVVGLLAVLVVALAWTAFRIASFMWITEEENVWSDFGGWFFGAIFIFLCWSTLYHGIRYFYLLDSEHHMKLQAEALVGAEHIKRLNAESAAKEAQLQMLRYQLNPHFLFNTLNAISSLVQLNKAEQANGVIVRLSRFLRYSLDNNPDLKVPLRREIDALMLYLEIEKTRFEERLHLDFQVDPDVEDALLPSLLFQPLIENSVKYAIAKSPNGGAIRFRASKAGERVRLVLSDTGSNKTVESSRGKRSGGRGIGLKNTLDRLKIAYGEDFSFDLGSSDSGGLQTTIEIPYEASAEELV
ncbi:histidine kinase [Porticoccus sp. W117]|uniref:sensor histidine kinase n=1 Tax=Porticoccus sp. W117 TaxID=3054777 RepID=UPI002595F8C5|nr:histidine kinase [Porticoccus sp. W117]MDM3870031.1 histidine kinase [Porticoccus sp. W117]